jgi:hypothetical protein
LNPDTRISVIADHLVEIALPAGEARLVPYRAGSRQRRAEAEARMRPYAGELRERRRALPDAARRSACWRTGLSVRRRCCPARQYHRYKKIATEIHGSPPFPGFSSDA